MATNLTTDREAEAWEGGASPPRAVRPSLPSARGGAILAYLPVLLASIVQVAMLALIFFQFWVLIEIRSDARNQADKVKIKEAADGITEATRSLAETLASLKTSQAKEKAFEEVIAGANRSAREADQARKNLEDSASRIQLLLANFGGTSISFRLPPFPVSIGTQPATTPPAPNPTIPANLGRPQ